MIFIKRKPGESVVLETPEGEIVLQMLAGGQLGLELPRGVKVSKAAGRRKDSWLPSRPAAGRRRIA